MTPIARVRALFVLTAAWAAMTCWAQSPVGVAPSQNLLTEAEVRARHQNCPDGYYSGPRPGKARYTKDPWMWVVTPEFARKFCMPPEFVSHELKGAEAIAYKLIEDQDEESCGTDGKAETCRKGVDHRFEIYYRNGTIPKRRNVPYFHAARLPSAMLLTESEKGFQAKLRSVREKPRTGALGPFFSQQFGLRALQDGKVVWALGTLGPEIYYEEVFEGIDYLALQCGTGFSNHTGWIQTGARQIAITVRNDSADNESRRATNVPLSEYALVIEFPQSLADHLVKTDKARGLNLRALTQEALKSPTNTSPR